MRADSIIFDLDGTLWDSCEEVANSWSKTLKERFPDIDRTITYQDIKGIMGMVVEEIAVSLFPNIEKSRALEITNTMCEEECSYLASSGGKLYEGLEDVLKILSKQYPLFIVSNCQCGYIESFLQYHKLGTYFQGFLCSGQTGKKKGENIKLLMKTYGLKQPIYIGDTHMDYEATKQANIPFIYAAYGFGTVSDDLPALSDIRKLPAYMECNK